MADLKANSTVGGLPIWHQGNFPLNPVTNSLYYKTYKIYTEFDKPQAVDNDFVSKASGGTYAGPVIFNERITIKDSAGKELVLGKDTATTPLKYTSSLKVPGQFAISTEAGVPFIIIDPTINPTDNRFIVMGNILGNIITDVSGRVYSPGNKPKKEDVGLGSVTNDIQVKLLEPALQTLTGNISSPNMFSRNAASEASHLVRFDQVVVRDAIQDFGEY